MHMVLSSIFIVIAGLVLAGPVAAQSNIAELIEQTGIEEGDVALRDMPGWREPKKIVMPDVGLSRDELRTLLPGIEVVIARSTVDNVKGADAIVGSCYRDLIDAAEDAIWIQVFSAGVDRCVGAERIANGSAVLTNMQKMSAPVIGEHVVALALSLARKVPQFARNMPTGEWHRDSDLSDGMMSVTGKTMLVVGLGGIGTEAARRAAALGMRVTGTRRSSREGPDFVAYVGLSEERFKLAAEADFIVNALPLTPETTGLLDAEFFNAAKKGAILINVGRGPTVVTDDLVAALESGRLAGAGLDVTDPEPLPADHPLWQMDNVIITPHVSGRDSNRARHLILFKENLKRFAAGDALLNVVDPELGY
ncbi:MAG: D-2-hydroxyacid dehydrogenase [Gammaproteobacteria bacterium]|nr:D-2-hydroxyacid dehydrogenase [Gammaproteobacteria bacterium]